MQISTRMLLATGLMLSLGLATADDAKVETEVGHALYQDNCLGCHKDEVMTRTDRRVKNLTQLDSQVRLCDANLNLQWMDDDIEAVAKFLNKNYYRFPTP
jgi:hypothetical protein